MISQEKLIVQCKLEKQLPYSNISIFPRSSNSPNSGIYDSFTPEFCSQRLGLSSHNLFASSQLFYKIWCFISCLGSQLSQLTKYHVFKCVWVSYPKTRTRSRNDKHLDNDV